ncbi:MAG TPA: SIMPL domain-containing protein [Pyrinomonadaceae bacterium]|nr:SIMPL domain-containing protein [Pyrinomonadaceae bacterium]
MWKTAGIFVVMSTLALTAYGQNPPNPPLITVSGQAEVRVQPDEVVFTLGVESVDSDMLAAQKRTDDAVKQVLSIARANNIKPEDVQTSYISIQPKYNTDDLEYGQRQNVKREFVGYQVSKTIAVTLRDISRFDSLLSDVLKAGVTRLSNVEFRDSKIRQHKDQARAMAIKAAQEKAKLLAGQIGQSIGPAYSITESGVVPYLAANVSQNRMDNFIGGASDAENAIAPGTISVSAQVTVSFRLMN